MKAKIIVLILFVVFASRLYAQDTLYAREVIDTLTSRNYHGRGYTDDGLKKAAEFLRKQFISMGLQSVDRQRWVQELKYPVNRFPGKMSVRINGRELRAGFDYIVAPESRSLEGKFELTKGDSTHFLNTAGKLIVTIEKKLTWKVSTQQADYTTIILKDSAVTGDPVQIELNIEADLVRKFKTGNVCAMVQGTRYPDSFMVFTAHYDHLGEMGREAIFPGANDNASGVSLVLGLAKYYSKNPPPYSVAFILFTGEEAGLIGSKYFTDHPLIPLKKIRFLINLDLTGTGAEGITVVNATEFSRQFEQLKSINSKENLFTAVNPRGKAKNSDHYWFTERGVPSFFIYTLGGIKAYHDVYDRSETLPNDHYAALFRLLTEFVENE